MELITIANFLRDEMVRVWLLLIVIGVFVYAGIRSSRSSSKSTFRKIRTTIGDYRAGKYYKPWRPANPIIIVSTKKQIAELSEATQLSQRAVYADMFGFKHTMNKLDHDANEQKVIRTRLYGRILQVNGPIHLHTLYPHLCRRLDRSLKQELDRSRVVEDGLSVPIAQTVRRLASRLMSLMFFGEELSSNPEFQDALLRYPQDMVKCMAAFQITPSFMSPIVHAILTRRGYAMHIIQKRCLEHMSPGYSTQDGLDETYHLTIMRNMVELTRDSTYWNPELLSQSLLGIWFAAAHQPWMNLNFVVLELCARPEWQAKLRDELAQRSPLEYQTLEQLPILDSFIKETVRLNPLDTLAIRRKALQTYEFADGSISAPKGATVCVSAYNLMHNAETYPQPDTFNPSRFTRLEDHDQRKFTQVSETFPVWGYGSLACPGRFHASLVIKMVVSELLLRYELRLEDPKRRTRWSWETFTMPYESTRVVLKQI